MRTGRYSIGELFGNRHISQLIIPEIQRDYVWESKQVEALLRSILSNFEKWHEERSDPPWKVVPNTETTEALPQTVHEEFAKFYSQRTRATNVGFVYAYCDADLPRQYFLIDGQQRLTTLYLALLALASRVPELRDRFRARYCLQASASHEPGARVPTKLDYKVREHTAEFLRQFVRYLLDGGAIADLKDRGWHLERLINDRTVENLVGNFTAIEKLLSPVMSNGNALRLYEYLEDLVECWYFDTNESSQGEELYLYLNARGESIAENENLKARLLSSLATPEKKDSWGRKWEEWQDYFWNHRADGLVGKAGNPNADRGFNSFLRCIEYLEKLQNKGAPKPVTLELIETYLESLRWLEQQRVRFMQRFNYADWVEVWFSELWGALNEPDPLDWSAAPRNKSKSREHNHMVLVWGSLLCVLIGQERANGQWADLDEMQIFRAIRIFYLRYRNFGRAVAVLPEHARAILNSRPEVLGRDEDGEDASEERVRWDFLSGLQEEECQMIESVMWKIEDHPLNAKGGRGLGNRNITHLVELTPSIATLPHLEKVCDVFYDLFPPDEGPATERKKKIASVLLYYGPFWHRVSPWYYENYELGDWPRTIRGRGSNEQGGAGSTVFRRFFDEFLAAANTVEEFAASKEGSEPVDPKSEQDLRKALIWYYERAGIGFLRRGMHVAKTYEEHDAHFPALNVLWNTQGDFRGTSGNRKLGGLVALESQAPTTNG